MLINVNRIADATVVVTDLDVFTADQLQEMDNEINNKRNGGFKEKHVDFEKDGMKEDVKKLTQLLRVIGAFMAIFGAFHMDLLYGKGCSECLERKERPTKVKLHSIYCYVVTAIHFAFFIRAICLFTIQSNESNILPIKIIVVTWSLQVLLNVILLLKASHPRWGHNALSGQTWDTKVLPLMECLDVGLNIKKTQRILWGIFITGFVVILFNIVIIPVLLFQDTSPTSDTLAATFIGPIPVNKYTKLLCCVFTVFQSVAWIAPVMYLMALCFLVRSAFKVCKIALSNTIDDGKETNTYPNCLYRQRILHLNICRCLELMDKDFQYMYANLFFTNIPLACFILYQILKTEMDALGMATYFLWLVVNVLFVSMATLSGATVNNAAHSMLDCIYDVGMQGISLEQLGQLNLFTSKLNGSAIGFTVMQFVSVTKELFLTVGGLYITYFFILLQF